jgi:nicotinate-nucleotide adenylyltransferase
MRIGIFGGTFDPVHNGHLLLAESCREECQLDRVWFLPASVPPHKQSVDISPSSQRVDMLQLAISGNVLFEICDYETTRGGVNYTVDTLAYLREQQPKSDLFLLMGGDSLADLPNWRDPQRICELAMPVVVRRPGMGELDLSAIQAIASTTRLAEIRRHVVDMPRIDLSAREIRARVAAGKSIQYRVPRAVEKYIETHGMYRS